MTEPEDIQRLIRLKRHEQPPEGFMDEFMVQLHQRQRSEMLRQSALGLLWERIGTYLEGRASPNLGLVAAAAAVVLAGLVWWMPHGGADSHVAAQTVKPTGTAAPASSVVQPPDRNAMFVSPQFGFEDQERPTPQPARLGQMLLSQHFGGGYADEAREAHAREGPGAMPVNATPVFNQNAPLDLADPAMQQNGSLDKIQKLGQPQ